MDPLKPWPVTPYSFSISGGWLQGYGGSSQVELCSYQQILENRVREWDLVAPDSGKTVGGWWLGVHRLLFHRSVAPKNFLGYVLHIWVYCVIIYCFFTWTIFTKKHLSTFKDGYCTLTSLTSKCGLMLFKMRPKLHMFGHLMLLDFLIGSNFVVSPLFLMLWLMGPHYSIMSHFYWSKARHGLPSRT